jgi:tetratricopeptide (TPR) repeat protein
LARDSGDADLLDGLRASYALAIGWAGRHAEARRILLEVLSRRGALLERRTEAHHYLALLSGGQNEPGDALHHAEAALRCLRAQRHPSRKMEASLLMSLGNACSLQGRMAEADRHFAAAFARVQSLGQERTPQAVTLLNNWAVVNERAGDARRMLELAEQALALAGPDGASPFLLINRGRALEHLGRLDEAAVVYSQAERLASERRMVPPRINALLSQGSVALRQGRIDAARDALAEADRAGAAELPVQHPQGTQRALLAGRWALAVDDLAQAAAQFERALHAAPQQASAVTARLGLVDVWLTRGEPARAVEQARAALELAQTLQGGKPESFRTTLASLTLARALNELRGSIRAGMEPPPSSV